MSDGVHNFFQELYKNFKNKNGLKFKIYVKKQNN